MAMTMRKLNRRTENKTPTRRAASNLIQGRAKLYRKNPTDAEARMMKALKGMGEKMIRFQVAINFMIVDFSLPMRNLLVEVDGQSHLTERGIFADQLRDRDLRSYGFHLIRITNDQTHNASFIKSMIGQYPPSKENKADYMASMAMATKKRREQMHPANPVISPLEIQPTKKPALSKLLGKDIVV